MTLSTKEQEALEDKDTKYCTVCKEVKPLSEFAIHPTRRKFSFSQCRECDNKRSKRKNIKQKYNITLEDYDKIFEKQSGKCKICGTKKIGYKNRGRFCVDHDHETGKIRGLLCVNCNLLLGHAKDDIKILALAIQYLTDAQ